MTYTALADALERSAAWQVDGVRPGGPLVSALQMREGAAILRSLAKAEPCAWLYEEECSTGSYSPNYMKTSISRNKPDPKFYENIRPLFTRPAPEDAQWQPIETAPTNERVIAWSERETAMAWHDLADREWYYSPQSGLLNWEPTHWMPLPKGPTP